MRKSVLTGLFACTLVLAGGSVSAEPTILNNETTTEKTVVELLSLQSDSALAVIDEVVKKDEKPAEPAEPVEPVVIKHVVAKDETLSDIAKANNLEWKRIFDKNTNLADPNVIHVGLELVIPAVEEQLAPRELPAPVIAPVVAPVAKKAVTKTSKPSSTTAKTAVSRGTSSGNGYVAGYCTWYIKNRRPDLPNNLGNANTWVSRAAAQGIATGSTPSAGAVGQRNNHVVYVESVNGDGTINISEMNYQSLYTITSRTVNASDFSYIY